MFDIVAKRVWVAGHNGMVGSAIVRRLGTEQCDVLTVERSQLDLTRGSDVEEWMSRNAPQVVFLAAGRVGGIVANSTFPADFLRDNVQIALNVIRASHKSGVEKLLYLGSSCIYPRAAAQPMMEDALLSGPLEPTNQWYAIAKICGIKLVQAYRQQHGSDFIALMPTNLYGQNDNYHPEHGHVPAALLRRFHEAKLTRQKQVVVWGTGKPRREFMAVDDLADACVFAMKNYSGDEFLNIGTGEDITIADFARVVADVVGFDGEITFDTSRPDGTARKLLDVSKVNRLGWRAKTQLRRGLEIAYADFLAGGGRFR
jgi:GDP-L-fucose synthase